MQTNIKISQFNYNLPSERIAKFPLPERDRSKLLVYKEGVIDDSVFSNVKNFIPEQTLLVFNNSKVIKARLLFSKPTGARIEIFCLEPLSPNVYELSLSAKNSCSWHCIVGNSRKWKDGTVEITHGDICLKASRQDQSGKIDFTWNSDHTFGELLEELGRVPVPPYLERDSEEIDNTRYQTTYAVYEGSVAAPTAGLHFTEEIMNSVTNKASVTLHVGAGTFLPVKEEDAEKHHMHTEFFTVKRDELYKIAQYQGNIISVGTTTVRTLESLAILGERVIKDGSPSVENKVAQWEGYQRNADSNALKALLEYMDNNHLDRLDCSTEIMIVPGYEFRTIKGLITNFHQPCSTLLLLISAIVGDDWKKIYNHALENDYRFLSYGDSSLLFL